MLLKPPRKQSLKQNAYRSPSGPQLRHFVPVQQTTPPTRKHIRRRARKSLKRQIPRSLVPGQALQRLGLQVSENWRPNRQGARACSARERSPDPGHPGEPAPGARRLGGSRRGQLPHRGEGRGEGPLQRQRRSPGRELRRPRGHEDLQPRGTVLQANRVRGLQPEQPEPLAQVDNSLHVTGVSCREPTADVAAVCRELPAAFEQPESYVVVVIGTVAHLAGELLQGLAVAGTVVHSENHHSTYVYNGYLCSDQIWQH